MMHRHVSQRIHRNETANDACNENHNDGKIVDNEIPGRINPATHVVFKSRNNTKLKKTQESNAVPFKFKSIIAHRSHRQHIDAKHDELDPFPGKANLLRMSEIHDPNGY